MSKNRQQRRHPIHPALPIPDFSGEKVPVENSQTTRDAVKRKGKKAKNRE